MSTEIAIQIPDVTNSGKARRYVLDTITSYRKLGTRLHVAACVAFFHAAEYGDASLLNMLHGDPENKDTGLRVNDRTAFRVWCGNGATVSSVDAENKPVSVQWLGFRAKAKNGKKPGFYVKKGTESVRVSQYDINKMVNEWPSFMAQDVSKPAEEMTLEKIMAFLAKVKDQVSKKAETDDGHAIAIPQDVAAKLSELTALATAYAKPASTASH